MLLLLFRVHKPDERAAPWQMHCRFRGYPICRWPASLRHDINNNDNSLPGQMAQAPFVQPAVIVYVLLGCDPTGPASDRGRRAEEIESQREG
jgi:hypothetical protein